MSAVLTVYQRLALMSVQCNRVTDGRSLPGAIHHDFPADRWYEVDGSPDGLFLLLVDSASTAAFRNSVAVVVCRFIFDHGVAVSDLIDHAFVESRAMQSWVETTARRWPPAGRHSGWALQCGTYSLGNLNLLAASTLAVHERGNVGYLVHATATVLDGSADHADLLETVQTVNFVD
ncbi:hypothetical protein [Williamsia sp. CHRR-6]|uniref:hypothetical protein n=1 Tax=Williamsia sp. CHRR-6 TaxID=2835871 RepID=UPI001BDABE02|nr:hypothetical protein [Williamsia sp. CHRR-6]MBT0566067.1 hypothetical protein [Williamsia sp. CHRR-6]